MWRGVECGRSCHQRSTPPVKSRSSRIPGLDPVLMGRPNTWRMGTADVVVRRRGLVLVCWAAALAVLAPHAVGVERVLATAARVDRSESARVEAELASRFRAPFAQYALLVVRGASPLTPAGRELGDSIRDAVAAVPGVAAVRGYRDGRDTLLLGRDSSGTFVLVGLDAAAGRPDAIVPQLRAATAALARRLVGRFPELELRWTGETVLNADLRQASRASARVAERRALPLTMALLLVAFGSLVAAGTPVVSGVLVIVLALGASGMLAARWPPAAGPAGGARRADGGGPAVARPPCRGRAVARVGALGDEAPRGGADRGGRAPRPAGVAGDALAVGATARGRMAPAGARVGRRAARLGEDGARGGAANRPRHPGASQRSGRAEPCRVAGGRAPPGPPGPGPARIGHAVLRRFPLVVALVLGGTLAALFLGFRSVLVPLKAVCLNLLSVAAGFGAVVLVFQDGNGAALLGLAAPLDAVFTIIPTLVFCTVFGLSMDYEIFLVARVAEARRSGLDERAAIAEGLAQTGPVITSAAAVMVAVFAAFTLGDFLVMQILGLALAVSVALDATVVRVAIGPALLALAGRWNWWPGRPGGAR